MAKKKTAVKKAAPKKETPKKTAPKKTAAKKSAKEKTEPGKDITEYDFMKNRKVGFHVPHLKKSVPGEFLPPYVQINLNNKSNG